VDADGHRADPERIRDLGGPPTLGQHAKHVQLPAGQGRGMVDGCGEASIRQDELAGGRPPQRVDVGLRLGWARDDTACARRERGGRDVRSVVACAHEDADPRVPDPRDRGQAGAVLTVQIDERKVHTRRRRGCQGGFCIRNGAEHARRGPPPARQHQVLARAGASSHHEHTGIIHPHPGSIGTRAAALEPRPHNCVSRETGRMSVRPNRLAHETSPYLLQHADNPVDWYPWGEEALAKARAEDKPIFLSVGYAACHWCHVMERESFEDERTAAFLNEGFVAIKVDREERPDIDGIYMDAVQGMTGSGGWPMSVFLTPDGKPFYAGTYFPNEPRHGMPAFLQVLQGIAEAWDTRRDEVEVQGGRVAEAIGRAGHLAGSTEPLTDEIERAAIAALRRAFDAHWGGFGGAPKFPQPMTLEFVLRMALRETPDALEMLVVTLDRMADGGIHDQVGGGFHRYSTDGTWHVPHFEKMLYDNAQLAQLYTRAWLVTRNDRYRVVATRTLAFLLREMRHADGGFFSSQDADSEGVEGRFFAWTWDELVSVAGEPAASAFGALPEGNWEGTNVLWRPGPVDAAIDDALRALFEAREARERPATDDKIITAWNALAIRAFAEAGRAFDEPSLVEDAVRCATFVWGNLRDERGRLLRTWRNGVAGRPAFADDHALLADAFLTLYETTSDLTWFRAARELSDALIRLFADEERGGFFQTGSDADPLVVRPKDLYDNAVPSGNSAAAETLQRLGLFTGDPEYERAGVSALRVVRDAMSSAPSGSGHALCALDLYIGPSHEIAIIGAPDDPATRALVDEVVRARFLPNVVLAVAASDSLTRESPVGLLAGRSTLRGAPAAYVCERFACQTPVGRAEELARLLN
jgi:uncharacterized protein